MQTPRDKQIYSRYQLDKFQNIEYFPSTVCIFNDQLWVGGFDMGIFVCDFNLQPIKHIKYLNMRFVTGLAMTSTGNIIVSDSKTGLHCLNQQYHQQFICRGFFSCVSHSNDVLYALEYKVCAIFVIKKSLNRWVIDAKLPLHYDNCSDDDKVIATKTYLYVSSCQNNCIYILSLNGELQFKMVGYGSAKAGSFIRPILSDIDDNGNLLVCDCGNSKLQVYYAEKNEWEEVSLAEGLSEPFCAVIGQQHIWVGTLNNKFLKYMQKAEVD